MIVSAVAALITSVEAIDRITFKSAGTRIVGYHWKPSIDDCKEGSRPRRVAPRRPAIVMAHGLAALQTSKLQPYAARFAKEGYHAITVSRREDTTKAADRH